MSRFKKLITGEITPWVSKEDLLKIQSQLDEIVNKLETHESKLGVLKNNQHFISQTTDSNVEAIECVSNSLNAMTEKASSTKHTIIAISSWASFFVVIGFATYLIASYM